VFGFAVGLIEAIATPYVCLDFFGRKNKPILGGIVGDIAVFMHLENLGGVDHLTPFVFAALGLDLTELLERTVEQAGEALLVNADVGECATLVVKGLSQGEGSRGSRFIGADGVELVLGGEGKERGLDGGAVGISIR